MDEISFDKLLGELEERKKHTEEKLNELEELKEGVKSLFPKEITYKTKFLFQEKIDSITKFYELILRYENQLSSVIKDEITLLLKNKELEKKNNRISAVALQLYDYIESTDKINNPNIIDIDNENRENDKLLMDVDEYIAKIDNDFEEDLNEIKNKVMEAQNTIVSKPDNINKLEKEINTIIKKYDPDREKREEESEKELEELINLEKEKRLDKEEKEKNLIEENIRLHKELTEEIKRKSIFLDD